MKYRKVTELKRNESNPRLIKDKRFEQLKKSIRDNKDYFEARPIILSNRTGELVIIAGDKRFLAAQDEGMKEVPTHLLEGLTAEREREILARDNVNNGEWDYDTLANEWDTDLLDEWGVNLPITKADTDFDDEEDDDQSKMKNQIVITLEYDDYLVVKDQLDTVLDSVNYNIKHV